jgi:hypothetical protein
VAVALAVVAAADRAVLARPVAVVGADPVGLRVRPAGPLAQVVHPVGLAVLPRVPLLPRLRR